MKLDYLRQKIKVIVPRSHKDCFAHLLTYLKIESKNILIGCIALLEIPNSQTLPDAIPHTC